MRVSLSNRRASSEEEEEEAGATADVGAAYEARMRCCDWARLTESAHRSAHSTESAQQQAQQDRNPNTSENQLKAPRKNKQSGKSNKILADDS
jgi:hypothetical protein